MILQSKILIIGSPEVAVFCIELVGLKIVLDFLFVPGVNLRGIFINFGASSNTYSHFEYYIECLS